METNDQSNASEQEVVQPTKESASSEEKKFVPVTAYKEVSSDMHKFKSRAREAEAKANELAERLKAIEENTLKEQQKFEELYEREKAEREREAAERMREKELYLRSVKVSALKNELGGKVKDEYVSFANLDAIEIREDGTLSSESVQSVANAFRQEHPSLIATDSAVNITGTAPGSGVVTEQPEKTLANMTVEEKVAQLAKLKQNRS